MDNDDFRFDHIKREVLPDGRIRYSAEQIVEEIEIPRFKNDAERDAYFASAIGQMEKRMMKQIAETNPYMDLLTNKTFPHAP